MQNMAEKVPIIELVHQLIVDMFGKLLIPIFIIAPQRNIQRNDLFHLLAMNSHVANRCARRSEPMQTSQFCFVRRASSCMVRSVKLAKPGTLRSRESMAPFNAKKPGRRSVPSQSIIITVSLP